ncbi:unnamed protein product [Pleuronectes platessa]|uniref:Uncharacterized protein n=1 Tax=Pleuronectes platessa TaxID=8262 RepID=A0A9N7YE68_PLEPL|nr:unnamed protein product [Pleuronectes platessa]
MPRYHLGAIARLKQLFSEDPSSEPDVGTWFLCKPQASLQSNLKQGSRMFWRRKAALFLQSFEGLADPASFSIQPTTGGQRCSSQLTPLKEISSPFKLYKTPRSDAMSCRKTSTSI